MDDQINTDILHCPLKRYVTCKKTRLATANRSHALAFVWLKFRASGVVDL